jgi:branched-chain amino acid aminotransferase
MAKYSVEDRLIWLNGEIVHVNDAKINILSPTSQFGLNVFEGIPCYWNEETQKLYAFRLDAHYKRLQRSARLLQLDCPYSPDDMKTALIDIVKANDYREDISVRQTLFVDGFGSWGSKTPVGMFVAPIPRKRISDEYNKKGLNCCISSWQRINDNSLSPRIKCGANYINSRMAQLEALRNGYDTTIILNNQGKVSEGPGSCIFLVRDGKLVTPQVTDSVLESITRETIIFIAREIGVVVEERTIDRTELYMCDEAFLCGSAMEITPVLSVDKYVVGSGEGGELTDKLHREYLKIARGQGDCNINWLNNIVED